MYVDKTIDKEALLRQLKFGDEDAFRQVFTLWNGPVIRFIDNIIDSRCDAEDICQDTFATLWEKRETIDTSKNISTLIFLIAKQKSCNFIREHKRKGKYDTDSIIEENSDVSPEELMRVKEIEELVKYAIDKLSPRTREIYELHYSEGLSYEQIAERLGINTANVKAQIHQARTKIRDILISIVLLLSI